MICNACTCRNNNNLTSRNNMFVTFYLLVELRHVYSICKLYKLLANYVPLFNRVHPKSLMKNTTELSKISFLGLIRITLHISIHQMNVFTNCIIWRDVMPMRYL